MKLGRTVLGAVAALGLGAAGVIASAGTAFAADALSAPNVDEGQNVTISISACKATDTVVVDVVSRDGQKTTLNGKAGTKSVVLTAPEANIYTATLTCVSYNGTATKAGNTDFAVWPTGIDFTPSSWTAGDPVTIEAYGFAPGETVSLKMVDASTGKVVWSDGAVATVDADGVFTYKIVLKSDVPLGTYQLIATGDESGTKRISSFYWGSPDDDNNTPKPSAPVTSTPDKPGLPSTGA